MNHLQKLGANLLKHRERCGMSLRDVEEDQGLSKPSISEWENGKTEPGALKLHALAACYGVPVDRFFEGVG